MALIGTISGSNGTTTSAVTGSMIIAANPGVITPVKPAGVVLFVSGAASSIGADDPSIIFKGDSFVSGALGTDSYIQMKPVSSLRIPTNTTASYIYTSGSTNDLYFTQYQPGTGYTNTTRLRWLESGLQTGLLRGGSLSTVNGTTTFSVTSGSGLVISMNATLTSDPYPTITNASWPDYVSQSLTYITSSQITYIGIDSAGALVQRSSPFSNSDDESYIVLGRVLHQAGSVTNGVNTAPIVSYGASQWHDDYIQAIGPLKLSGHVLSAAGANLQLNKTSGDAFAQGRNYTVNPSSPNIVLSTTDTAVTTSKVYREYVLADGVTYVQDTGVAAAGYTDIDPSQYNNGGTLASVASGQYSIQRVFWFPNSTTRAFTVYYGNSTYNSLDSAQASINSEMFTEGANTKNAAILVAYLIVKGNATNLSNTTEARFVQAGIYRSAGTGGGGGGTTVPGGSDTYVQFNDAGSFGGNAGFKFNKSTTTATIGNLVVTGTNTSLATSGSVQIKDGAGVAVVTLTNTGNITGSNLLLSNNFIASGSGIIESNTSTSALRVTQQGSGNAILVEDSANPDSSPFVVAADGKVGIGTAAPTANLFVSGTDPLVPTFIAKGPDVTVNTLSVTGSSGASTAIGFVNIDQGNYSSKYGLMISNIGAGQSGLKLSANSTGGSFAIDNMNATPQVTMTHKNLWFRSDSTAFDTSQVTYKFIENNKSPTYPNQKTFLISGNINGLKTGSYFEVEKSGSSGPIKLMELQGDTTDNALYVSGSILSSGSVFIAGDLAVSGGDITTTAATFNLITGSATTVNFAQSANSINVGKLAGTMVISSVLTGSSAAFFGESVTIGGPSQADILTTKTTATLYNTVATTVNIAGAANTVTIAKAGSSTTVQGNLTSSNLAVNGGNITSTAGTLNIASTTNVTNLFGSNVLVGSTGNTNISGSSVNLNAGSPGFFFQRDGANVGVISGVSGSSVTFAPGPGVNTVNIANPATTLNLASGSGTTVQIGASTGRTTIFNDLALGTGNLVVANDATPIQLISSGNVTVKLDVNNNGVGHYFAVQDYTGVNQLVTYENGNTELSGTLVVSGNSIQTTTTTTYNLLTTALTGTLNIGNLASSVFLGGSTSTGSILGDFSVAGKSTLSTVSERMVNSVGSTGTVTFDLNSQSIFYVNNPAGNITANFVNVPTNNNRVITPTVILSQSATPRVINAVQIDAGATTLLWANKVPPVGTANQQEVYGFSLIRSGSTWTVLGQMSTYG